MVVLIFWCCTNSNKLEKVGNSDLYETDNSDKKMEIAISNAKSTFKKFKDQFFLNDSNTNSFSIKMPFSYGEAGSQEHIWIGDISFKNGDFYGIIDNTPEYTKIVKEGEKVKIDTSKISDWQYVKNDTLFGGFTIKVIRDELPEEERKNFNKDYLGGITLP